MGRDRKRGLRLGRRTSVNSSSSIMEKRGDAWLTPREQHRIFNRRPDTETPDFDAQQQRLTDEYWERKRKLEREAARTVVANPTPRTKPSLAVKMANVRSKHRALRKDSLEYRAGPPNPPKILRFCDGCRLAACRVTNICQKDKG
jgi:hypothetical protein